MDPYVMAHSTSLILCIVIVLYHLATLIRSRPKGLREAGPTLALIAVFLTFSITEISLIRYYELVGGPFVVNITRITLEVDAWLYALASVLLTSSAVVMLAFYLMELKVLYLVPLVATSLSIYITYFTYRLMGIAFFAYLSFNPILSATMALIIGMFLLLGLVAVVLLIYIYLRTKSMRALSFAIGVFIMGMLVLGVDSLISTIPMALIGKPAPYRGVFLEMLRDWPLNIVYILASLLFFLGQTRVLDALFRAPGKEEKAWIERMMETT